MKKCLFSNAQRCNYKPGPAARCRRSHPASAARPPVRAHGHDHAEVMLAVGKCSPMSGDSRDDYHRRYGREQDARLALSCLVVSPEGRRHASLAYVESGGRHGDGPGRIRCQHVQAWAGLHQYPNDAAQPSGCQRGREDWHQLRWLEERNRGVQFPCFGHHLQRVPLFARHGEHPLRLC